MRISDWSSDVCSSDLRGRGNPIRFAASERVSSPISMRFRHLLTLSTTRSGICNRFRLWPVPRDRCLAATARSEEHTSELQSLTRNSYAVICLQNTSTYAATLLQEHNTTKYINNS